jgi:hypothetical protein
MKKHAAREIQKNLKTSLGLFTEIIMCIQFKWKKIKVQSSIYGMLFLLTRAMPPALWNVSFF